MLNDAIVEGTETVTVNLTRVGRARSATSRSAPPTESATVNITDNDTATVSIAKINDGAETDTPTNG